MILFSSAFDQVVQGIITEFESQGRFREAIQGFRHLRHVVGRGPNLAKANDGESPELLRSAPDGGTSGHAESLAATLAEHQQHLSSIQVLINQLKELTPAIQKSIAELIEEANSISSTLPPMTKYRGRSPSPIQAHSNGRTLENSIDEVTEATSKLSTVQLEKTGFSPVDPETKAVLIRSKRPFVSALDTSLLKNCPSDSPLGSKYELPNLLNERDSLHDYVSQVNGFLSFTGSNNGASNTRMFYDLVEAQDQVYSPSLIMEASILADSYEDLLESLSSYGVRYMMLALPLGMVCLRNDGLLLLSETETALMDH
ncbi:hypothetical protein HHK36_007524 [Tetracentron sinense]|uniref:Uncharacterized protein n=1 Tax=Tetracentron sinense TaxID=13715 RepID=A0A834ZML7_TETSI|nr:hypothetical protein HHK36_007524 [Tetracentron sinense]